MKMPKPPKVSLFDISKNNSDVDPSAIDEVLKSSSENRVRRAKEGVLHSSKACSYTPHDLPITSAFGWEAVTTTPRPDSKFYGFQTILTFSEYKDISVLAFNPRNFEATYDESALYDHELFASIKENNQNAKPVVARFNDGKIELIEGSRRLHNAKLAEANLFIQIYFDVSDKNAEYLTYVENHGRAAIGVLAFGKFLLESFNRAQKSQPDLRIKEFAQQWEMAPDNITRYLNFGRMPAYLRSAASYKKNDLWTWRKATKMRQMYEAITEKSKGGSDNYMRSDELRLRIECDKNNEAYAECFSGPTQFNKYLGSIAEEVNGKAQKKKEVNQVIQVKHKNLTCSASKTSKGLKVDMVVSLERADNFALELTELINRYTK